MIILTLSNVYFTSQFPHILNFNTRNFTMKAGLHITFKNSLWKTNFCRMAIYPLKVFQGLWRKKMLPINFVNLRISLTFLHSVICPWRFFTFKRRLKCTNRIKHISFGTIPVGNRKLVDHFLLSFSFVWWLKQTNCFFE